METTPLKKGSIRQLPVKEIRTENKRSYYIVIYGEKEYAISMFEFQKADPKPELLTCIVKEMNGQNPVFIQDLSPLYSRFYIEGNTYSFWVKRDCTDLANGYYELADWNGFYFKLQRYGDARLYEGQRIQCVVRLLNANRLCLELVQKKATERSFPIFIAEEVLPKLGVPEPVMRWAKRKFMKSPLFKESREAFFNNDEGWALVAIREMDENINLWVKPGNKRNVLLLDLFHRICLYLLEDSDYLNNCPEQERKKHQKMLSGATQNAEIYMEALSLIERGEHIREIDILLTKMKKSGYLFQPDRRLRVLMCIFSLEQGLTEQKMQLVFDIILNGNKENWKTEPFRSAFIQMLDLFIHETRRKIDLLANVEDEEGKQCLTKIIEALAIQLLLATDTDDFDRQLSQSMLYRYLTYVDGSKADILLDKSFRCLSEATLDGLEFGWNEVNDLTLLAIRLSSIPATESNEITSIAQTYQGKKAQLQLADGNIRLQPLEADKDDLQPQIPEKLLPWQNIQILTEGSNTPALPSGTTNLNEIQQWWKGMEYDLFGGIHTPKKKSVKARKYRPATKDIVNVRITGHDIYNPDYLFCKIEDDLLEGEGSINIKNFVRYNLRMEMQAFVNPDGKPYLLQAEVLGMNKDGQYSFSMINLIHDYIRQCLSTGDITRCVVMDKYNGSYLCISEYGYSVQVSISDDMPELMYGSYVEVRIDQIRSGGYIDGSYLRQIIDNFRVQDAFANLINGYADEKVYEEEEDEKDMQQQEVLMDETCIIELIHIIDRMAMLDKDYIKTYHLLNVARFLSMLIESKNMSQYYNERMKLLQMLQQFAINGKVDNKKLYEQGEVNGDMIRNYPLLQTRLTELQCISSMDHPERNDFLWEVANTSATRRLAQIARLCLTYNMLQGFSLHEEREAIHNKLNQILNIEMKTERPRYFGHEDQHTEFKTSLVFPADNSMRPDLKTQTKEIMKVICGFLNAEGGTLYLGVNNEGVASGLDEDMPYFKGNSMDSFDLHVRNNIFRQMGAEANARIKVSYPDAGKKTVYAIEIQPSPYPIKLDNICYVRQGSSTWPILGQDLERFLERRAQEVQTFTTSVPHADEPEPQNEPEVPMPVEETTPVKPTLDYRDDTTIQTSKIRPNAVHNWEEGYGEETARFLHFLPKEEYMLTDEECWDDTLLTLAIHNDEADGYVVMVYESGSVVKTPMNELLDKTERQKYKRCKSEKLIFACPCTSKDALFTIVKDANGNGCYRLDDVANLKTGRMVDKGETLSTVANYGIVICDIIPAQYTSNFKHIHNLKNTTLGNMLTMQWGKEELVTLDKLGILPLE